MMPDNGLAGINSYMRTWKVKEISRFDGRIIKQPCTVEMPVVHEGMFPCQVVEQVRRIHNNYWGRFPGIFPIPVGGARPARESKQE